MSKPDTTPGSDKSEASVGDQVFNNDGEPLGIVRSRTDTGFVVSTSSNATEAQRSTSGEFGEAYLMWRCLECGEMGDIKAIPDQCPNCEAERESLYYWTED